MTEINSARPDYELVKVTLCYISFLWIAQLTQVNTSLLCFIHRLRETALWPQTAMTPNCHFNTITCAEEQPVWAVTLFSGSGQSSFHPRVCPEKLCRCFASFRCVIVTSRIPCYIFFSLESKRNGGFDILFLNGWFLEIVVLFRYIQDISGAYLLQFWNPINVIY